MSIATIEWIAGIAVRRFDPIYQVHATTAPNRPPVVTSLPTTANWYARVRRVDSLRAGLGETPFQEGSHAEVFNEAE
ncbi:MAG TPA: hypothetical protein VN838_23645 [Bradyrhizobium sp.]|nr:hypothetical protein [Bradyrhizobium sp.]